MILIDTSAWVDFLRGDETAATREVRMQLASNFDQIAMCEPVAMELLAGSTGDTSTRRIEQLVNGLPSLSFDVTVDFRAAADLYRTARRSGKTVRSLIDCLIASLCLRHEAVVLHKDADYETLSEVCELRQTSLR